MPNCTVEHGQVALLERDRAGDERTAPSPRSNDGRGRLPASRWTGHSGHTGSQTCGGSPDTTSAFASHAFATNQRITRSTRTTDETAGPEVQSSRPPRPTHAAKRPVAHHPRRRRTLRVHDAGRDELRWLTAASPPRAPRGAASERTPVLERCSCPAWVAVEARLTPARPHLVSRSALGGSAGAHAQIEEQRSTSRVP